MNIIALAQRWSIGKVIHIERYPQGQHNQTYKVDAEKGMFSLRIYNYKKPPQINFEVSLLNVLKGLPVPQLVARSDGKYSAKTGQKYAILYHFLPGGHLNHFTATQLQEVGRFIGQFHTRGQKFQWNKPRYQFYDLPDAKIRKFEFISRKNKVPHLEYLPTIIKELKENRLSSALPQGPIHVDIKPENALFYREKMSGIIDFDNSYIGPLLLDLAKSMVWFGTRNKRFHVNDALNIYYGYIQERKLTEQEHAQLYKAIKFAFLSHIFVDYYMRAMRKTSKEYFEFIINDLYAAYQTFAMTEGEFYSLFSKKE